MIAKVLEALPLNFFTRSPRCGGEMKIISFITGSEPIEKILGHIREKGIDARAGPFADSAA